MEELAGGFTLELCPDAFPLSTDSIALSAFARLPKNAGVLDLGSGCGTLGLLLCSRDSRCHVTGIELSENAHAMALQNIRRNNLDARLSSICADIAAIPDFLKPGSFDCCVSNPPYFTAGPASQTHPLARREDRCSLAVLFRSAAWALKYGGDFFLVHRPERLAEICGCAIENQLEPKRLQLLRHSSNGPVSLVLIGCRKGGKPGLIWEEESLYTNQNKPTDYFRSLYHL